MVAIHRPQRLLTVVKIFGYGHGGAPESVFLLARALSELGVTTDVLCKDGLVRNVGALDDLPHSVNPCTQKCRLRLKVYGGVIVVGAWNFTAFHTVIRAACMRIPVLYAPKGGLCTIEFKNRRDTKKFVYLALVEIWVAFLAKVIMFSSALEQRATILPHFLKTRKGIVLPEPLDANRLGCAPRVNGATKCAQRIGFIAQISPRKGLSELVDGFLAWKAMAGRDAFDGLYIAGTPLPQWHSYFQDIQDRVRAHACGKNVHFVGQVSGDERRRFYQDMDIVAVPSHFESFCLTITEALAFGCRVLAGVNVGVLEFLGERPDIIVLPKIEASSILSALDDAAEKRSPLFADRADGNDMSALSPKHIAQRVLAAIGEGLPL